MFDRAFIAETAERLERAERTRSQIRQLSIEHPQMTIEDAYAIQSAWIATKTENGRVARGRKIGLTSKAMQYSSNISEPDYGVLLDDMFFEDGAQIPVGRFILPRLELNRPLRGPACSIFDVLTATQFVVPALEIIDARIQQVDPDTRQTRKVVDTIADNAGCAGVVLGGCPRRVYDLDLRWVSAVCYRNAVIEESGVAAAVLNHPANGVAWLANKLAPFDIELSAGEIVLAGSFTRPMAARSGDTFHVDYGSFGSISCFFA